jgi:N-acetylneuraminate synthase
MTRRTCIHIGDRRVGPGEPVYVVAEISANHNQDCARAIALIDAAADSGADAVKVQVYRADTLTIQSDRPEFRVTLDGAWSGRTLFDLYSEGAMPWDWLPKLHDHAKSRGLGFVASPFDTTAVDALEEAGLDAYKIGSCELVDLPLIAYTAARGRPVVISTGMGTVEEIGAALATAQAAGSGEVALLRCNAAYPAPADEMDLSTLADMRERFSVPIGLSDHTLGINVAIGSVALGAVMIEKHFTLARRDGGIDSAFSLEPHELAALVDAVREVETALGTTRYGPAAHEVESVFYRRSLYVVAPVRAGEQLTRRNVASIRPALGLAPAELDHVIGRHAAVDIAAGTPLAWDLVADA